MSNPFNTDELGPRSLGLRIARIPSIAWLFVLATSGCAVGPSYVTPESDLRGAWISPVSTADLDVEWWRSLNDPVLTHLVETAIVDNMDLDEASARVREARARRDAVRGRAFAQVGASASATENRTSANGALPVSNIPGFDPQFPLIDVGFDASWEIDLWGAKRRATESADARVASFEEARRSVVLQVIAEVVRTYIDLRTAQNLRDSAIVDATSQEQIARIVEERLRVGLASRFDLTRARAQARTTASTIPGFEADAAAAAYRLALLLGQPPEAFDSMWRESRPLPTASLEVNAGLRSDLLQRRPDVRQAERDLAAATADIGVATADLFPRISLLAGLSQQARETNDLFSTDSLQFQVGPTLHWPIFSGGSIRARIRAADARAEAAAIRYERSVLTALADSETAINRFTSASRTRADRDQARREANDAVNLARRRYVGGEDDLTVLLQAQSNHSVAERSSIQARAAELQLLAALYKALGGGWEGVPDPTDGREYR
jgi:NodT family efflux transporter outer membrane factor (OMF) lipoprotein